MFANTLEAAWLDAFVKVFDLCKISSKESVVVLTEHQTRPDLVQLAELALGSLGCSYYRVTLPTPSVPAGPLVRSSGASLALNNQSQAVNALCDCDVVVDLTVEGLMHAIETAQILSSGTRILNISNEHPEILSRLVPRTEMKDTVKSAVAQLKDTQKMSVESPAGTDLTINMVDAKTVGVWGWTDRPGTLAHWPGGLVVSFPSERSVNGQLVLAPGDLNLSFKRYLEQPVTLKIEDDFVTSIDGAGADCALMRAYLESFDDKAAYATSHVGWGLNRAARYESLTLYDRSDINGTELRAVAGNFLYSTGANEFAGRFTRGHFDLPVMNCTISLDGRVVVDTGILVE
ncbi:MAG: peptidase M29 [Gammaproteobacteria bacterium]|nr:peptidase M29 [Gammaproteobacteria bacterium]